MTELEKALHNFMCVDIDGGDCTIQEAIYDGDYAKARDIKNLAGIAFESGWEAAKGDTITGGKIMTNADESPPMWQPIETAQKRYNRILVCQSRNGIIAVAYWNNIYKHWSTGCGAMSYIAEVTHWMPLPKPPENTNDYAK